jgi:hypothetical protein
MWRGRLVRSVRLAVGGAGLLFASVAALVALPSLSPFELLHCPNAVLSPPAQGSPLCFSSVNPAYPAAFLLSLAGTVILFFGAFGRSFVVSPVFVVAMIALGYGLSGVVSGVLDAQRASTMSPVVFAPLVAIGAAALCFQTFRRLRRRPG